MTDDVVELYLDENNLLYLQMSGVTYCIDSTRLQTIIDNKDYEDKNEDFLNGIVVRHLVNKLMTLLGKKLYSQVRSIQFDID